MVDVEVPLVGLSTPQSKVRDATVANRRADVGRRVRAALAWNVHAFEVYRERGRVGGQGWGGQGEIEGQVEGEEGEGEGGAVVRCAAVDGAGAGGCGEGGVNAAGDDGG